MTKVDDEIPETIEITDLRDSGWENQRTIYHLECVLYKTSKYVKVYYSGLGDLNVCILDVYNNVVAYQYGSACDGTIMVPSLLESGVYRIYIESDTYCGEGYFEI